MVYEKIAALCHKLWASKYHQLKCTKDGRNWTLDFAGSGWDASYTCFVFDGGLVDGVDVYSRLVHIEDLLEDVQKRFGIDILEEVSLDDWH
jgi:hypothetical protein